MLRSPAKAEAAKQVPYYQLGLGEGCKECVASLFDNLQFHFAGTWSSEGNVSVYSVTHHYVLI